MFDISEVKLSSVILISDDGTDVTGAFRVPEVVYEHYYVAPRRRIRLRATGSSR